MSSLIDNRGFVLAKDSISDVLVKKLKKDLEVYPETNYGNFITKSFKVFKETKNFIVIPIYYALQNLDINASVNFPEPRSLKNLINCGVLLRQEQIECFEKCSNEKNKEFGGGIINLQTGKGKCLAKNTKIVMYDGSMKNVQDVKLGDKLMGDDSTPRNVLSLASGQERMYKITSLEKSDYKISYTVNESHILSLRNTIRHLVLGNYHIVDWYSKTLESKQKIFNHRDKAVQFIDSELVTERVIDVSVKDYISKNLKMQGYRVAVEFDHINTPVDPYVYGKAHTLTRGGVPGIYKINSINVRLAYLAGLIDGSKNNYPYYTVECSNYNLEGLMFTIYSLGLTADVHLFKDFHFVSITGGDLIEKLPLRSTKQKFISNNSTYDIKVERLAVNDYYGFEIDGNRRFLLKDFTVTHNTVVSIKLISHFSFTTLIIVNKVELMEQWKKELNKFLPDARIGLIQGTEFKYVDCDIVIGMLQTISMKQHLDADSFSWVDVCIIDEIHNIASEVFSRIMFKIRPRYLFGLSATLERKDKMEKVIKWYIGDVLYSDKGTTGKQSSEIHVYKYKGKSSVEKTLRDGTASVSHMISNIADDLERTVMIINIIKDLCKNKDRRVLVISDRTAQLKFINKKLGDEMSGLFIGSLKSDHLEISKTKQVLLGTYGMVNEGFNHPVLNTLVFATPRSSITQAIGRIYRKNHTITPVIVDIFDDFSIFKGQHYRRKKIYKENISDCIFLTKNYIDTESGDRVANLTLSDGCCFISDDD